MFVRVKTVVQDGRSYEYLQIVRSVRDGTRVRQELVASLGRRDLLVATGQLDQLLQALARFSTRLRVVEAAKDERFVAREAKSWGPALVFGRLWERQGLPAMLGRLAAGRRFGFDPERVAFALALQRLCAPGSDLQGAAWAQTVEAPGFADLALHHFYRTVPWLAAIRHELERELFFQGRDLFSGELDLGFVDTTSVDLSRDRESALIRHGYGRDRRPDLPQLVLCVAVDGQGWPVACAVLPGNTAEVEALSLTIARFRTRFRIRRAVVVADRGMFGRNTLAQPVFHPRDDSVIGHIVGCFLALRLEVDLQRRLDAKGLAAPWPDLMRDLAQVQAVVVDLDGQRYRLRTELAGSAHAGFAAAGIRPPNSVTRLGPTPATDTPDS